MTESHPNTRLEAFCDGVFAIAITLLIIELKLPSTEAVSDTTTLWNALARMTPTILAFLLSFLVIFITWVNHHHNLKMIHKSSTAFIYANGFMLLTVIVVPFPTALLGEYLISGHASPAVILYSGVLALQAVAWNLVTGTALRGKLCRNEKNAQVVRLNKKYSGFAMLLYSLCAVFAIWFPVTIAVLTALTWICWLILGLSLNIDEMNS